MFYCFLRNLFAIKASDLFTDEFVQSQSFHQDEKVIVIDGHDLDPLLLGHKEPQASNKDFLFFYFYRPKCNKPYHRLIQCRYKDEASTETCTCRYINLVQFYDHMRGHLKEKVFKCLYCPKRFTQKGNLTRHMQFVHGH